MQALGILGGTFDPIHRGHIELAQEACQRLDLRQVRFIPVHIPPHRQQPVASAADRLAMIETTLAENPLFIIDHRELDSDQTSYTINTLKSLRKELPDTPLCLLMGEDAFSQIDSWYCWQELLDYAHIVVASRPGKTASLSGNASEWLKRHETQEPENLKTKASGLIYFLSIPLLDISSTAIRAALADGQPVEQWLTKTTIDYIKKHQLYQDTA